MATKQNFEDGAAANDIDADAVTYRCANVGSFGMDDLLCYATLGHCLPDSISAEATFSLDHSPVYRDLAICRSVTMPSALGSFTPVTKPHRLQACYSEPSRTSKRMPPPLPEMFVLEKSHLVLKDVPLECALDNVLTCLNDFSNIDSSIRCDCEVMRKDFKIRGMVHSGFDNVDFRVCVFRSRSNGQMALPLVEFQRRSGDLFLFRRFFSSVSVILTGTKHQTCGLGRAPPIMMDLGDDELDLEDEIEPLATLLESEYMDMQLEGVRALGQVIGQTADTKFTAALPQLIKPILKLAASIDRELRCAVVSLIATMCTKLQQQNTKDAEKLMAEFVVPIVRALQNVRHSYTTAHTQRECVRALSAVSHRMSCGKQIVQAGGVEALRQCSWQADDTTKLFAQTALRNLVACR